MLRNQPTPGRALLHRERATRDPERSNAASAPSVERHPGRAPLCGGSGLRQRSRSLAVRWRSPGNPGACHVRSKTTETNRASASEKASSPPLWPSGHPWSSLTNTQTRVQKHAMPMTEKHARETVVQSGSDDPHPEITAFVLDHRPAVEAFAGSDKETAPYLEAVLEYASADDRGEGRQ